jgi:hypothetical protein
MDRGRFSQLELQIEELVEGSFARLFAGRLHPREVATHLARAMEDNSYTAPNGEVLAPNRFTIHLNPDDYHTLMTVQPDLDKVLKDTVINLAFHADMHLMVAPTVSITPVDTLTPRRITVTAARDAVSERSTQMLLPPGPSDKDNEGPRNPQLIVGGTRYVSLDRPVINIGRRHDNHIVVDDRRVSRQHAQLRLRFGHYVLYDLGSSGGTHVNEHAIKECLLKPGDVISLAGVPLIYIEDDTSTGQHPVGSDTQIRPPNGSRGKEDNDPTV